MLLAEWTPDVGRLYRAWMIAKRRDYGGLQPAAVANSEFENRLKCGAPVAVAMEERPDRAERRTPITQERKFRSDLSRTLAHPTCIAIVSKTGRSVR
jgi:hypothetical protein